MSSTREIGGRIGTAEERDVAVRRVLLIEAAANAAIACAKAAAGLATGSLALLGDAAHSLTDLANNGVAWVVVRWSTAPPDASHPYGHRKFETVAVFLLATLLAVTAFELAAGALRRGRPEVVHADWALFVMLGVLVVNLSLATWESAWARRLGSDILSADSRHTFADVLTTLVVLAGWQAAAWGYAWVDTVAALGVALLIFVLAFGLFQRSLPALVDRASIDPEQLRRAALQVPGVTGVLQPRSRAYGQRAAVDLVILVEPEQSTSQSHEIATRVERLLRARFPVDEVAVHVEPGRGGPEPELAEPS